MHFFSVNQEDGKQPDDEVILLSKIKEEIERPNSLSLATSVEYTSK